MKITIGIEKMPEEYVRLLDRDLAKYGVCRITKDGEGVQVQSEGDVVHCSIVVAICDKYRFDRREILNSG